jgi:hypothetical protein
MKKVLRGKSFANVEEVKKKTTEALKGITLNKFQDSFEKVENTFRPVHCMKWTVL